jgi:hypothetical protein
MVASVLEKQPIHGGTATRKFPYVDAPLAEPPSEALKRDQHAFLFDLTGFVWGAAEIFSKSSPQQELTAKSYRNIATVAQGMSIELSKVDTKISEELTTECRKVERTGYTYDGLVNYFQKPENAANMARAYLSNRQFNPLIITKLADLITNHYTQKKLSNLQDVKPVQILQPDLTTLETVTVPRINPVEEKNEAAKTVIFTAVESERDTEEAIAITDYVSKPELILNIKDILMRSKIFEQMLNELKEMSKDERDKLVNELNKTINSDYHVAWKLTIANSLNQIKANNMPELCSPANGLIGESSFMKYLAQELWLLVVDNFDSELNTPGPEVKLFQKVFR